MVPKEMVPDQGVLSLKKEMLDICLVIKSSNLEADNGQFLQHGFPKTLSK